MEFLADNEGKTKKTKSQRKAEKMTNDGLVGEIPDFSEEGWARRKTRKE